MDLDILIIEANHSFDMLLSSSYPDSLKRRILSSKGHLSNWHTAEFISKVKPKIAILSHISEQNNSPETALCEVEEYLANSGFTEYPFFVIVNPTTRSVIVSK